jgi:hypothetical protein
MDPKKVLVNLYVGKLINKFEECGYDMDEENTLFMKELFTKSLHNFIEDATKLYEKTNKTNTKPDMDTSIDTLIKLLTQMKTNKGDSPVIVNSACSVPPKISKPKKASDETGLDGRQTNPYNYFTKWISANYATERKKNGLSAWKPKDFSKMWKLANKQVDETLWASIADTYDDSE